VVFSNRVECQAAARSPGAHAEGGPLAAIFDILLNMRRVAIPALIGLGLLASCSKKDTTEPPKAAAETPVVAPAPAPASGPHVFVHLADGSKVPGTVVASSQSDIVVDGDDGIERKIPLAQVKSVEYGGAAKPSPVTSAAKRPAPEGSSAPSPQPAPAQPAPSQPVSPEPAAPAPAPAPPPPPPVTTKTFVAPAGAEISVRTNEPIDSGTAAEGQMFEAEVTRNVNDAEGEVVIPRGAPARIVIKSASKGGKFKGAADLVLDLETVTINGHARQVETVDVTKKGKDGVGVNTRTATHVGGGAALGAIIGAIAGGGKGAAIGAGAGAGAGALTQIFTKGGSIKVPAESVLTFRLDQPLHVRVTD
jgi:hypothetical protein